MAQSFVDGSRSHVLPLELAHRYPVIVRGEGVWVEDSSGRRYLDAMSGGSMAATLGHGRRDIVAAAEAQAETLSYVHNERLTNPAQEQLAHELVEVAPDGFTRIRFTTTARPWRRSR
jgi:adenosylmethionine-8-amino-7-oxononanoate aminotransferase